MEYKFVPKQCEEGYTTYKNTTKTIKVNENEEVRFVTSQKLFNEQAIRCFEFLGRFLPANYLNSFGNEIKELKELNETIK